MHLLNLFYISSPLFVCIVTFILLLLLLYHKIKRKNVEIEKESHIHGRDHINVTRGTNNSHIAHHSLYDSNRP